jgi:hypothetical protein
MRIRHYLIFSLGIIVFSVSAKRKNVDSHKWINKKEISVVDNFESRNSFISYITIDQEPYLLKQKKLAEKQFSIVRDALAAWIAKDLNIAHSAHIIPLKEKFVGKKNTNWPAVILSIAPGKTLQQQPDCKYYYLSLKQRGVDGLFSPDRWFTETIINQMTWHPQLPIIIALDIFICNTDRHGNNLFYDPSTDTFCAIDMDNIYRRNLPLLTVIKLLCMIAHNKKFTKNEIEALKSMRDTLQFLIDKHSSKQIIDKLRSFVKQAGFKRNSVVFHDLQLTKRIDMHKQIIRESRASLYELIELLDMIINQYTW